MDNYRQTQRRDFSFVCILFVFVCIFICLIWSHLVSSFVVFPCVESSCLAFLCLSVCLSLSVSVCLSVSLSVYLSDFFLVGDLPIIFFINFFFFNGSVSGRPDIHMESTRKDTQSEVVTVAESSTRANIGATTSTGKAHIAASCLAGAYIAAAN